MSYDQPWAPFPVQDWSTMPFDPLAPPPPESSARQRRWWLPLAVLVAIALVIGSLAYVGSRDAPDPVTAAGRFLPADGTVAYERSERTRSAGTDTSVQVSESARLSGIAAALSGDTNFGARVFADLYGEGAGLRVWRTISTVVDDPAHPAQTTTYYRVRDALELLGNSGPDGGLVFRPGLVELPADVHDGQTWSSSGSAGELYDYRSELRATAAPNGCLETAGDVRLTDKSGQQPQVITLARTWCPGQGLVASTESQGSTATRTTPVAPPDPAPVATIDAAVTWTRPETWTERKQDTVASDPTFGESPISGTPASVAPVRTASGRVVRAVANINDLVGSLPKSAATWASTWRAHVPGTIVTLSAFGDVVIATTGDRVVVAYSDRGVRLWQIGLDELAPTAPVRVSDTEVTLVDLSGRVQLIDIATGAIRWQHDIGSDVNVSPAAGDGLVVIMDRGGTATALDQRTGASRWTVSLEGKGAAFVGGTLVILQDQTAHGIEATTGRRLWLRPFFGTLRQFATFHERFVIATDVATVLVDTAGVVDVRLPGFVAVTVTDQHLVGWGTTGAQVVDREGAVLADWPLPPTTIGMISRPAIALDDGALLFGSGWTNSAWASP